MELRQLLYFVASAKKGLTNAAESLHVSQSALSLSNKRLEDELGAELFCRDGRGLKLTPLGQEFLIDSEELLRRSDLMKQKARRTVQQIGSKFSLAVEAEDFATDAIFAFGLDHPNVSILPYRVNRAAIKQMLLNHQADLSLALFDDSDKDIVSIPLLSEPMDLMVNRSYRFSSYDKISLKDLEHETLILEPEDYGLSILCLSFFLNAGLKPLHILHVSSAESMALAVDQNLGLSFLPRSILLYGRIRDHVSVPLVENYCRRTVYLSYLKEFHNENLDLLISFFRDYGQNLQARLFKQ